MKINADLTFNTVQFDQETEAHLVLGLSAPAVVADEEKRPSLCIIPLIDVSGSMEGQKLAYAKRSLIKLIEHLSARDYCGLVEFTDGVEVLSKPVKCTTEAKEDLKKKVGELRSKGSTNIAGALLQGFELANKMDLSSEVITRVILFTDGAANTGPATTPKEILQLVKPNIGIASVSAFGYGSDALQDFLLDLAKRGNGNYAFVQNPDDALSAFGKELGGLLSTYATNLVIEVAPLAGHQITQVVSDVEAEEGSLGNITIKIPDILSEETRNLVLAVKLQSQKNAFPRGVNVFEVSVGYDTLDANLRKEHQQAEVKTKVQFVQDGEQQKDPNPDLDRIVGLAQIARAQIEAEEHAKKGDFSAAVQVMSLISDDVNSRGLGDLGGIAKGMGSRLGSSAVYTSNAAYFASMSRGVTRGMGGTYSVDAAQDLSLAGVSMSNSSQDGTAASFRGDSGGVSPINPGDSSVVPVLNPGDISVIPVIPSWTGEGTPNVWIGGGGTSVLPVDLTVFPVSPAPVTPVNPLLVVPFQGPEEVQEKAPEAKPKAKKISQKAKRW